MPSPSFTRTRPYVELSQSDFRPRDEVRREIMELLDCMTGERYKFKLVICREETRKPKD